MSIELIPIGVVKNSITSLNKTDITTVTSEVRVYKKYKQALDRIEDFSDIIIVYWMDQLFHYERSVLQVHPQGRKDMPMVGVFACRSPARPNPLGVTRVKLLERSDTVLKVYGLDAINGTPVIDIKPYIPRTDLTEELRLPDWIDKLH
jgi:tRNA-Thr(GGU) m(6)t(6)A37 methyltransferase TsaA